MTYLPPLVGFYLLVTSFCLCEGSGRIVRVIRSVVGLYGTFVCSLTSLFLRISRNDSNILMCCFGGRQFQTSVAYMVDLWGCECFDCHL